MGDLSRRTNALFPGDLAPWFRQRLMGQESFYAFDMVAGRHVVLCFYGEGAGPAAAIACAMMQSNADSFADGRMAFFGVSHDGAAPNGTLRHFDDQDGVIARAFGVAPAEGVYGAADLRCAWYVLDPRLRVAAIFPLGSGDAAVFRFLRALPSPAAAQVPVLAIPAVFESEFCERLIRYHQAAQTIDSAVLTEAGALTDHSFKSRQDCRITDGALANQVQTRIFRRVVPEILHAFQFRASRLERMILACYDAAENGRFGAHRDNTIPQTAHRRFAVSINLNNEFEGGEIAFPEYGSAGFKPPAGAALVFSCSMLHAVSPVRRGRRYALLPFVYDEPAAELRRANLAVPVPRRG